MGMSTESAQKNLKYKAKNTLLQDLQDALKKKMGMSTISAIGA